MSKKGDPYAKYAGANNPAYPRAGDKWKFHRNGFVRENDEGRIIMRTVGGTYVGFWGSQFRPIADAFSEHPDLNLVEAEALQDPQSDKRIILAVSWETKLDRNAP